jgi:hypothetical protein
VEENTNINPTAASTDALKFYWVFRSEWLVVNKMLGGARYRQKLQQRFLKKRFVGYDYLLCEELNGSATIPQHG